MATNKELNNLLQKLLNSVKDTYDISGMIRELKDKPNNNLDGTGLIGVEVKGNVVDYKNSASIKLDDKGEPTAIAMNGKIFLPELKGEPELKDKEVSEKNYEIISCLAEDGRVHPYHKSFCLGANKNVPLCTIYTVKRLRDDEVFTVSDKTTNGIIESFSIEGTWGINVHFTNNCGCTLASLIKSKEVSDKPLDYEIMSFAEPTWHDIEHYKRQENDYFKNDLSEALFIDDELINSHPIFSVRRLSDNEVFSLGDKIVDFGLPISKIELFPSAGGILLKCGEDSSCSIDCAEKIKEPIVWSKDYNGNHIYEGGQYWYIKDWLIRKCTYACGMPDKLMFISEDNAKEYILDNQRLFSVKDILSISYDTTFNVLRIHVEALKTLAQQKIDNV